jgi:hypothetical protein
MVLIHKIAGGNLVLGSKVMLMCRYCHLAADLLAMVRMWGLLLLITTMAEEFCVSRSSSFESSSISEKSFNMEVFSCYRRLRECNGTPIMVTKVLVKGSSIKRLSIESANGIAANNTTFQGMAQVVSLRGSYACFILFVAPWPELEGIGFKLIGGTQLRSSSQKAIGGITPWLELEILDRDEFNSICYCEFWGVYTLGFKITLMCRIRCLQKVICSSDAFGMVDEVLVLEHTFYESSGESSRYELIFELFYNNCSLYGSMNTLPYYYIRGIPASGLLFRLRVRHDGGIRVKGVYGYTNKVATDVRVSCQSVRSFWSVVEAQFGIQSNSRNLGIVVVGFEGLYRSSLMESPPVVSSSVEEASEVQKCAMWGSKNRLGKMGQEGQADAGISQGVGGFPVAGGVFFMVPPGLRLWKCGDRYLRRIQRTPVLQIWEVVSMRWGKCIKDFLVAGGVPYYGTPA